MPVIIALALLCGAGIYIALGLLIGRNRYPPGARYMAVAMLGIAVWYVGAAGEVVSGTDPSALALYRSVKYVGVVSVIPALLLFVLQYATSFRGDRRVTAAVFLIPAITLVLVWTNPLHELMWPHPIAPAGTVPRPPWGPWFAWVYAPYGYVLLTSAVVLMARQVLARDPLQRMRAAVLLAAMLVPFAVNVAYVTNPNLPDVQQTPIALGITALIVSWGFFRFRIFQISPIALRTAFDAVGEAVLVVDASGRISDVNNYGVTRFGISPSAAVGRDFGEAIRESGLPAEIATLDSGRVEVTTARQAVLQVEAAPIIESGEVRGRAVVLRDVTAQRRAEDALRESEEMVRSVLDRSPNGILRVRPFMSAAGRLRDFTCTLANATAARYLAIDHAQLVGARLTQVNPPHTGVLFDLFRRALETQESAEADLLTHVSGGAVWFRVIAVPVGADVSVTVINITAHKQREAQIQAAALEDPLTGLLNRRGFDSDAGTVLSAADLAVRPCALLYVDLDGFKHVNDSFGHDAGDAVLVEFARRLRGSTRGQDLLARLGGDEFAVLATDCDDATARMLADRIRTAAAESFATVASPVTISASVGIAQVTGSTPLAQMIQQADAAMYEEKRSRSHQPRLAR